MDLVSAVQASRLSVVVRNFGVEVPILTDLNIKICSGQVYALVGPSGCGKTTFLRTVFGVVKPKSGMIRVFGLPTGHSGLKVPGSDIGYMPQNDSLCGELTVRETVRYFGYLYHMNFEDIKAVKNFLVQSLSLNDQNQRVDTLSGGEKRRVAFIGAVISSPKLIILDEPTVGCDPVISEFMWQHITKLTSVQKSTVIITTHYLEESRRAQTIGFMKKGQILCQGSPKNVVRHFGADTIEQAFATMYKLDRVNGLTAAASDTPKSLEKDNLLESQFPPHFVASKIDNYYAVFLAVFYKVLKRYFRYKIVVFGTIGVIMMLVILNSFCMGSTPKNLSLGIIDRENSSISRSFIERLDRSIFTELKMFSSYDEALEEAKRDRIVGFLEIFENLPSKLKCFWSKDESYCLTSNFKSINYHGNSVNLIVHESVDYILNEAFNNASLEMASLFGLSPNLAQRPMQISEPMGKSSDVSDIYNVRNFYLPVYMVFWSSVCTLMLSGYAFHFDMNDSVFEHMQSVGGTGMQLVWSHFLVSSLAPLAGSLPVIYTVIYVFHAAGKDSIPIIWLLYVLSIFCSVAMSLVLASLFKQSFHLNLVIVSYIFSSMATCGHIRPAIPYFIKPFKYFFPYTVLADQVIRIASFGIGCNADGLVFAILYSFGFIACCFIFLHKII